jgi:hypothetical protein
MHKVPLLHHTKTSYKASISTASLPEQTSTWHYCGQSGLTAKQQTVPKHTGMSKQNQPLAKEQHATAGQNALT